MWVSRIQEDNIFDKFKYPDKPYSRTCPSNQNRQPVIVTKEELDKINSEHDGSYFPEKGNLMIIQINLNFQLNFILKRRMIFIILLIWCVDRMYHNIKKDLKLNPDGSEYRNKDGNVESNKPGFCKYI